MRLMSRQVTIMVILALALVAAAPQVSYGDSITGGYLRFFYDGTFGTLDLSDGNTHVITFPDLDFSGFTGTFELYVGDRGPGTDFEKFAITIDAHSGGAGAHLLKAWDKDLSGVMSTHQLAAGEGSSPMDVRFVITQNGDDTWHVVPMFRLTGGIWQVFDDGPFDSADDFDLTATMLMIQFAGGASGIVYYTPPAHDIGTVFCVADPLELAGANPVDTLDIRYEGGGGGLLYGYSVKFSWDGSLYSTDSSKVVQGNLLSDQGTTWFEVHQTGTNEITVDCVLLGSQPGVGVPGSMFTVELTAVGCGKGVFDVAILDAVDNDNNSLSGFVAVPGLVLVDQGDPIFTINGPFPDGLCKNTPPILDLSANDPCGALDHAFYRVDGGPWTPSATLFISYGGDSRTNPSWILPGFVALFQGNHTVEFYCVDELGNTSTIESWSFIKDTVDPSPVTIFSAAPGNGKVHLSWTNPLTDFDHVVVIRKAWDASAPYGYPEYVQPAAGFPANPGDGVEVYNGTGESLDDVVTDRSIYFYHAFTYDCAGNLKGGTPPTDSLPAAFGQGARATNYWLGDVTQSGGGGYDGEVDFFDINALSSGYRRYDTGNPPVPPHDELDIGPSEGGSRLGIPIPNDEIEFPELVIFAMNYGVVTAAGKEAPVVRLARKAESGTPTLRLEPVESEEGYVVSLSLSGNDDEIQAASVRLSFDPSRLEWVETRRSDALAGTRGPLFFESGEENRGDLWIDLAALGAGRAILGNGEIARILFRVHSDDEANVTLAGADLRSTEGASLAAAIESDGGSAGAAPASTRLVGARPNPFNPVTTVQFELGREARVQLKVYDVQGRFVRTLADETMSAGGHTVAWDGRDDNGRSVGSGPYFVRMISGSYDTTSKVVLLK
ncbi:MAG: FlgD immunoglobulin-like domain containing protein [Candidatus Eisenbacteria bacterium]